MPKKFFRTLRFRLTLWNTVVVLTASLVALLAVRVAMRLTIENEVKDLLKEESVELELAIAELDPDLGRIHEEFERKVLGHSQHDWFAGLIGHDGKFSWKSENFPDAWNVGQAAAGSASEFSFFRTHDWLLVEHRVMLSNGRDYQIVLGEPIEFIRNDVWQLTKVMLLIGGVLLLFAPFGGYFLARHATRPVRQIIATTRSLNPSQLDSRLEIRGTGDELDQISGEINAFVDQISKYINSQREFVANAAHELRSPITAIQTSVEVTLDKPRSAAEYQDELETVSEQCQQLRHLVNQLLELAETETADQTRPLQTLNFSNLLEKSLNVFSGVAEEKEIAVVTQIEPEVLVWCEPSKLRQVINNLLDNALKFCPARGKVSIRLEPQDDQIALTVQDSGPGVPPELLTQIFERFFQVDPARQRDSRRGNGLGLSICRAIVNQYGGEITANNLQTGFQVQVRLPRLPDE